MAASTYTLHRRALTALNQLPEVEQNQVLERLTALLEIPVEQWPPAWARRLPGDPPLYLVRVNDSLRVFVQVEPGRQPELMDVVRRETLEAFAKAADKNGQ